METPKQDQGSPLQNGWVDAAQVKTQMYSNCLILLNKYLSVPEAGVLTEK